jgi:hypothetical protein
LSERFSAWESLRGWECGNANAGGKRQGWLIGPAPEVMQLDGNPDTLGKCLRAKVVLQALKMEFVGFHLPQGDRRNPNHSALTSISFVFFMDLAEVG